MSEHGRKLSPGHLHECGDGKTSGPHLSLFLPATQLSGPGQLCSVPEDGEKDQAENKVWARSQPKRRIYLPLGKCVPGENRPQQVGEESLLNSPTLDPQDPGSRGRPAGRGTPRASRAGGPRGGEVRALNTGDEKYPPPAAHPILPLRTGPAFTGIWSLQRAAKEFLRV